MTTKRAKLPVVLVTVLLLACGGRRGGSEGGSDSGAGGDDGGGPPPSGWSGETLISDSRNFFDYELFAGDVDVNDRGVAVALWGERITATDMDRLWSNMYRGGRWTAPAPVADLGSSEGSISVLPNGDAMLAYAQKIFNGTNPPPQRIQAKRYVAATDTWSAETPLSVDSATDTFPIAPRIAADSTGNAIAVWSQDGQVWGRRYDASAGWSATVTQLSASPRGVYDLAIVVDGSNRFTAVWVEDSTPFDPGLPGGGPNHPTAHARRFAADWEAGQRIGWADGDLLGEFDSVGRMWVDANHAGSLFVVWEQSRTLSGGALQHSIDAARFEPVAGTWSPPETIAADSVQLAWPQVGVDDRGHGLAIWDRNEASGGMSVRGAFSGAASGAWGTPDLLDQTATSDLSDSALAIDGAGNSEVAWNEPGKGVVERRFNAASGTWAAWSTLGTGATNLRLDMSDSGYAVLIGDRLDIGPVPFTREVWAWVYVP